MILQSLREYYFRKMADPDPARRLPAMGLEDKEIPFIIELETNGRFVSIKDTRVGHGPRRVGARYLVPKGVKRSVNISANLLWDSAEYALQLPDAKKVEASGGKTGEYFTRLADMHRSFRARLRGLPEQARADEGVVAVEAFLDRDPCAAMSADPLWGEVKSAGSLVTFRLVNDVGLICQRPAVIGGALMADRESAAGERALCLVTGEEAPIQRVHTAIKGVWGAQSSGANIVSFNRQAFDSFGKDQGANSPISVSVEFAYSTALNHLLARESRQRFQVGDTSTVFWAQQSEDSDVEDVFARVFGEGDDPDARTEEVRALLESIGRGRFDGARGEHRFFVLGLAPNAARIAVRFWQAASLREIGTNIRNWFKDLTVVRGPNDPEYPSLFRLLAAVAVQGKVDNVPPSLGGQILRGILDGGAFPTTWLTAAVQRCRAERSVSYLRAAAIKACLNRADRQQSTEDAQARKEIQVALDTSNPSVAYRLGRLFAVLERTQEEASPGLNATIRERYYGAASSTPVAVFTTLLRLKNHHLAKLENRGRAVNLERLIGEIVDGIDSFPLHLALPEQGRFAIGYYHQRQYFFARASNN